MGQSASAKSERRSARCICQCTDLHEETVPLTSGSRTLDDLVSVDVDCVDSVVALERVCNECIIQFNAQTFYCTEEEGFADIDVVRLGDRSVRAACTYRTEEGSAKAGHRFLHAAGTVVFEPGEYLKSIRVQITEDDRWDATLEFHMRLLTTTNAMPGKYLYRCCVIVIDDDTFPTNKYKAVIDEYISHQQNKSMLSMQDRHDIFDDHFHELGISLVLEYFKFNLGNPDVRRKSLLWMFLDLTKGCYYVWTIFLMQYLVDAVITKELRSSDLVTGPFDAFIVACAQELMAAGLPCFPGLKMNKAFIVGLLYVVPFSGVLWIDFYKVSLRIPGISRKMLQGNLFRKFLHFDAVRGDTSAGDITMTLSRDIPDIVEKGYVKMLSVVENIMKLPALVLFVWMKTPHALVPLLLFPIVITIFIVLREKHIAEQTSDMNDCQNRVVMTVTHAAANVHAIQGFFLNTRTVFKMETYIDDYNAKALAFGRSLTLHSYVAPALTTIMIGGWMVLGSVLVSFSHEQGASGEEHKVTLGDFMATTHVFKDVGALLQCIFTDIITILTIVGPLQRTTALLNHPSDLIHRKEHLRCRAEYAKACLVASEAEVAETPESSGPGRPKQRVVSISSAMPIFEDPLDHVPITIQGLTFDYFEHSQYNKMHKPLLNGVCATFDQGKLYALIGRRRQGKATFLKLLGEMFIPGRNQILAPPHLRVLHISRDAGILDATLWKNVVLEDDDKMDPDWLLERVVNICLQCGFEEAAVNGFAAEQDSTLSNRSPRPRSSATAALEGRRGKKHKGTDAAPGQHSAAVQRFRSRRSYTLLATQETMPTMTDIARLNLARALVLNPEFLVMHMPCINFSDDEADSIMELLKEHVQERGLGMNDDDPAQRYLRRPRTVFISASSMRRTAGADQVFQLAREDPDSPLRTLSKVEMTAEVTRSFSVAGFLRPGGLGPAQGASSSPTLQRTASQQAGRLWRGATVDAFALGESNPDRSHNDRVKNVVQNFDGAPTSPAPQRA